MIYIRTCIIFEGVLQGILWRPREALHALLCPCVPRPGRHCVCVHVRGDWLAVLPSFCEGRRHLMHALTDSHLTWMDADGYRWWTMVTGGERTCSDTSNSTNHLIYAPQTI